MFNGHKRCSKLVTACASDGTLSCWAGYRWVLSVINTQRWGRTATSSIDWYALALMIACRRFARNSGRMCARQLELQTASRAQGRMPQRKFGCSRSLFICLFTCSLLKAARLGGEGEGVVDVAGLLFPALDNHRWFRMLRMRWIWPTFLYAHYSAYMPKQTS